MCRHDGSGRAEAAGYSSGGAPPPSSAAGAGSALSGGGPTASSRAKSAPQIGQLALSGASKTLPHMVHLYIAINHPSIKVAAKRTRDNDILP
jgi:hypothetical protein